MSYIDIDIARAAFYDEHQELKGEHEFLKAAHEILKKDYERLRVLYLRETLPSYVDIWSETVNRYEYDLYSIRQSFESGACWAREAAIEGQRNNNVVEFIDFEVAKRDLKVEEAEAFRKGANFIFDLVLV